MFETVLLAKHVHMLCTCLCDIGMCHIIVWSAILGLEGLFPRTLRADAAVLSTLLVTVEHSGSSPKCPGANRPPEFVPESPLQKGVFESHIFLQGIIGKRHSQNLQNLREDTLGATCSASPFCLLPRISLIFNKTKFGV